MRYSLKHALIAVTVFAVFMAFVQIFGVKHAVAMGLSFLAVEAVKCDYLERRAIAQLANLHGDGI